MVYVNETPETKSRSAKRARGAGARNGDGTMGAYAGTLWVAETWDMTYYGAAHVIEALGWMTYSSVAPF